MYDDEGGNPTDLIFGVVGIVWCVVVMALLWTFAKAVVQEILGVGNAKHER